MPASLLDAFLPSYDTAARYHLEIPAPPDAVYAALRRADLGGSPLVRALFALRALPDRFRGRVTRSARGPLTLDRILEHGFVLLGEEPPRELVIGVVGRFWTASGERVPIPPQAFTGFARPGNAKAAWNFLVEDRGNGCSRLSTETRVQCLDAASRRSFRRYWLVVGPFSGLIRRVMLRAVRTEAVRRSGPKGLPGGRGRAVTG